MKRTLLLSIFLLQFICVTSLAQQVVDAKKISKAAKSGEDIFYENVTIKGILDFTNYSEEIEHLPAKPWRWWGSGENKKDEREISGKITFRNCTFNGDVIAYIVANDYYLFTASFANDVVFENCTFKGAAEFKYSGFNNSAIFSASRFDEEANFKYAKFYRNADFSEINARQDANFKYARFRKSADFSEAKVRVEANFKYAKFDNGLTIEKAQFNGILNFKYVNIDGDFNTRSANINEIDTKYAKVNGSSFTWHLLSSRD
jgi:hypothetical protein